MAFTSSSQNLVPLATFEISKQDSKFFDDSRLPDDRKPVDHRRGQ